MSERPWMDTLRRIHAHREECWRALGPWGRFKFRVRDRYAIAVYRLRGAIAFLREGDDDERWSRPNFVSNKNTQPNDGGAE